MSKIDGRDEVTVDGDVFTIAGTFGFLAKLQDKLENLPIIQKLAKDTRRQIDPSLAYSLIAGGSYDVELLKEIISSGIDLKNGEKVTNAQAEKIAISIIEAKGLEAAYSMAHFLLSGGMIGDEKKRELREQENRIKDAILRTADLKSLNFKEAGWLLAVILIPSFVATCASFSVLKMLT